MSFTTASPQRGATPAGHPDHARATIALAILGIFVTYVPITAVSVALTTIGTDTGASTSGLQWVSDAYVIPMAAAVLSAGVFGDIHGRRRVYLVGMALTILGGVTAGLGSAILDDRALTVLWVGQAIAGLGAGLLIPTTLALIAQAVPDFRSRGKFIGFWSMGLMAGLALGPIFSGSVLEIGEWHWIYAPSTALAVIAAVVALRLLPESPVVEGRRLDWSGQLTATVAIAFSIFGIIEGGEQGWTSWQALLGLIVGAVALAAFLVIERRSEAPLMDLEIFRSTSFSAAGFAGVIAMFSIVGGMFLLSLFLGFVQHLDALEIALRLLFATGLGVAVGPLAAKLMQRFKSMHVLTLGLVIGATGLYSLTSITADTGVWDLGWRLAIFGLGNTTMMTAVTTAAINSVPIRKAGMAAATNTVLRQYGGALGPAILGVVFSHQLAGGATPEDSFAAALITNVALLLVAAVVCVLAARRETHPGGTR
ncbi:MFS transporter [Nocardioides sp. cx-173]|uniref:MFS transporter n=1 Tax=Nocardioides sp. cx-173 TaxID=2898796 RepID=UPI001E390020|nr:MFS transporter [Nocardioides sp. cx-173]MCD4525260.1 MFS transporter [Nocardioides sp. cx-173]UGB40938.1 MFS transporter [Nocardioides sp. cx-173]